MDVTVTNPIPPPTRLTPSVPRPLPPDFRANGQIYRQIKRIGMVTLYSVSNKAGKVYGYEMAIVRIRVSEILMGKVIPEREVYPSNEEFGKYGWYYPKCRLQDAEANFNNLLNSIPSPTPHQT